MQRFLKHSIAITLASSFATTSVWAHAFLDTTVPPVGGSPYELGLFVTAFSGVQVVSDTGLRSRPGEVASLRHSETV